LAGGNPTGSTSTTGVMMGLGRSPGLFVITPTASGKVFFVITGSINNNTAGSGAIAAAYYGTGIAPANGGAIAGTPIGGAAFRIGGGWAAAAATPFTCAGVITGLTAGTQIWIDLSLAISGSGTATITNAALSAFTLP
jgi:hypothetical protein